MKYQLSFGAKTWYLDMNDGYIIMGKLIFSLKKRSREQVLHNYYSALCGWILFYNPVPEVARNNEIDSTNQNHYPEPGIPSSAWNFCARFLDIIWLFSQTKHTHWSSNKINFKHLCLLNPLFSVMMMKTAPKWLTTEHAKYILKYLIS